MKVPKQTLGEYRVGLSFNPSGSPEVDALKRAGADFIDRVMAIPTGLNEESTIDTECGQERARLKAMAATRIEEAVMIAVKAATKPNRE